MGEGGERFRIFPPPARRRTRSEASEFTFLFFQPCFSVTDSARRTRYCVRKFFQTNLTFFFTFFRFISRYLESNLV